MGDMHTEKIEAIRTEIKNLLSHENTSYLKINKITDHLSCSNDEMDIREALLSLLAEDQILMTADRYIHLDVRYTIV